jgi:hypothetical protein
MNGCVTEFCNSDILLNEKETINNSFDVIVIKPLLNHSFDPDQIFQFVLAENNFCSRQLYQM